MVDGFATSASTSKVAMREEPQAPAQERNPRKRPAAKHTYYQRKQLSFAAAQSAIGSNVKVDVAPRYLAERTRFLDPLAPHSDTSRYATTGGDYYVARLEVTPLLEGGKSVRQRVRQDVTSVLTVKYVPRVTVTERGAEVHDRVVVLARLCLLRLHHTELTIPPREMHELRESLDQTFDVMLSSAQAFVAT
ncbi:hypothetical protein PybrP1_005986 [[Pythium] brassicae (nom. inval.)]|nr:hypothetical protein PybrP1_005986 [[Pythium] brassicae (nom. inval.)]